MLKISTQPGGNSTRLVLEGILAGPWVEELTRYWRAIPDLQHSRMMVDLTGVTFIAAEGKALLAQMWRQGARFHAVGCLTKCIVEEITKADATGSCASQREEQR